MTTNKMFTLIISFFIAALAGCSPQSQSNAQSNSASVKKTEISSLMSSMSLNDSDCLFDGNTIAHGQTVTAYLNSTVPYGESCVSEQRTCDVGFLTGSYSYSSCSPGVAASCLFNGSTIAHGQSVTAYSTSSVPYGSSCVSAAETRTCNNGVLSGLSPYALCEVNSPRSCLFNGNTIAHGEKIKAFKTSTTSYGQICESEDRTCTDGTLAGNFEYSSCASEQAASCLFDGKTIVHGQQVIAFQASSVNYGQSCVQESRTCDNGVLSGSYYFSSCSAGQPAACSLNGQTIQHGTSVIVYQSENVGYGQSCVSETRQCDNGILSGSYSATKCDVDLAANCSLNGKTIPHGSSTTVFTSSTVAYGKTCQSETRTCENGILSGSASFETCVVDPPPVEAPKKSCNLNGQTIAHGSSLNTYVTSSVPYGSSCLSEKRICNDGVLSGSYTALSCTTEAASDCSINGKKINHGSSITLFTSSNVAYGQTCQSESRRCDNGILSGSASFESCVVNSQPPAGGVCQHQNMIWEFPEDCKGKCGKGNNYFKSRLSYDGGKTWLTLMKNRIPDEAEEILNYMIKIYGKDSCDRPKVQYIPSKNKGYVVLPQSKIPDCKTCRFVEVEEDSKGYGEGRSCGKQVAPKKKVTKLICGEIKNNSKENSHSKKH